jgi:hypothetical protein
MYSKAFLTVAVLALFAILPQPAAATQRSSKLLCT